MIDRVHDDWSALAAIPWEDFEALDINAAKALDGVGGGAYSPSAAVVVGGGGIMDANTDTHAISAPVSHEVLSDVTAHRLRVTGGLNVTSKLEVQFAAGGDGEKRELYVDYLPAGVAMHVRGEGGASIANGLFVAPRPLQWLHITIERHDGAWRMAARAAGPDHSGFLVVSAPEQAPAVNEWLLTNEYVYAQTVAGEVIMRLPSPVDIGGARRRFKFGSVFSNIFTGPCNIRFQTPDGTDVFTYVVLGREINTIFEFVASAGTWLLWDMRRNVRYSGNRWVQQPGQVHNVDTDEVEVLEATAPRGPANISNGTAIVIKTPLFEGQEFTVRFREFDSDATEADVVFIQDPSFLVHRYHPPDYPPGKGPLILKLQVVGMVWRFMGATR